MADEPEEDVEAGEPEAEADESSKKKRKFSGKKLVLFVVLPLLLLGGGGATFIFDPFGLFAGGSIMETGVEEPKEIVFYDMPDMLVNLSHKEKRSQYLKLKVAFEMTEPGARRAIGPMLPRIMDIFQVYLRELRSEDLQGSAGVYRLKEELLRRVNLILTPKKIDRVLFKEMIVQ